MELSDALKIPILAGFSVERLAELMGSLEVRSFAAGDTLIEQGAPGQEAYVLLDGRAIVVDRSGDGREIQRDELGPGALFGEMALLEAEPASRNASVQATVGGRLLVLPREVFAEAIERNAALHDRLVVQRDIQRTKGAIARSALAPLLAAAGGDFTAATRRFEPGDDLITEGEPGDGLYIVVSGTASVYKTIDGIELRLARLMRGGCAGEQALLSDAPRAATVRAETEVTALFIDEAAFKSAYGDNEEARQHFATLQRFYQLPDKGLMSQRMSLAGGAACLETTYELPRGRQVMCRSFAAQQRFTITETDALPRAARTCRFESTEGEPAKAELVLDEKRVPVAARIEGTLPEVEVLYGCIFQGESLPSAAVEAFENTGRLELRRRMLARVGDEIICHCMEVHQSRILQLLRTYESTMEQIEQMLGCGSVCGACREDIEQMLEDAAGHFDE